MILKKIITLYSALLFIGIATIAPWITTESRANLELPTVKINFDPYTMVYEGDIIDCTITGNPTTTYWTINNQSKHTTYYGDDPIIFDPEPTPLNTNYVTLTIYAENAYGNASDSVQLIVKRIYFGDIHWHTFFSDGTYLLNSMYNNAKNDNYLDFACSTDHTKYYFKSEHLIPIEWARSKNLANKHYIPADFTTFLAYEYSSMQLKIFNIYFPGWIDRGHMNFYYKDTYQDAKYYSMTKHGTFDSIFKSTSEEWDMGNKNICFIHHPLAGDIPFKINYRIPVKNVYRYIDINWTNFINKMEDIKFRENVLKIFRGVEVYSRWGTAIGKYSNIPVLWPYNKGRIYDTPDSWVENALWEWSENIYTKNYPFILQANSDTHYFTRPGSAIFNQPENKNPSGIMAAYSIHNTRDEIWGSMNNCNIYGTQLLKIRANVRFDGKMALGKWINCSSPLKITITAQSTFPGLDSSGKNMKPYGYLDDQLSYPIEDIWLIKKDTDKGRPWCKIINHTSPNTTIAVVNFEDYDVQPNDFYWIAIKQKGQELVPGQNEYMAFIGPVFIDNVLS